MENTTLLDSVIEQIKYDYSKKTVDEIAEIIGKLEREAYFSLVAEWKAEYKAISKTIHDARALRKGGNEKGSGGYWHSVAQGKTPDANRLMKIRGAIKLLARRHWEQKHASKAA